MQISKIVIIGQVIPEPQSSAAGTRMIQLIQSLLLITKDITFLSAANEGAHPADLKTLGVELLQINLNDDSFNELIQKLNPNLVVFDRFMTEEQYGWRVQQFCPEAIRVLDMEDVHAIRKSREVAIKNKVNWQPELVNELEIANRELASIYRCDLTLVISSFEMEFLQNNWNIPKELLLYFPLFFNTEKQVEKLSFEENNHFVMIGNFIHPPNYDAVVYLKTKLWKQIKKRLPEAEVHIYGAYASEKVLQLNNQKEGFIVKGWADDAIKTISKYKVMLAPIRYGAGLKGKLFDSVAAHTPFVGSKIAAEGIYDNESFVIDYSVVDETPFNENFVDLAVEVYQNSVLNSKLQESNLSHFTKNFSSENFQDIINETFEDLNNNQKNHRTKNIIGQILFTQQYRSTEYFSRWIEAKNKLPN
jgi:glycosyltransferase involved in cell wall biosynthesis